MIKTLDSAPVNLAWVGSSVLIVCKDSIICQMMVAPHVGARNTLDLCSAVGLDSVPVHLKWKG